METMTQSRAVPVASPESPCDATDMWMPEEPGDQRSADNIQQWREYLPADCISRMIDMGWDITT
jgi:hypothetical protein